MIKKLFDLSFSLFLLFATAPIMFVIACLLLIFQGRPIFFIQDRVGLNNKIFKIIKFRTMAPLQGPDGDDEPRIFPLGKFLRSSSLDELPELLNVLRGEMSIVGPRPLLVDYLAVYTLDQARRHEVLPGITGWAQINGRNSIDWDQKFILDLWYVENKSIFLDIKIIFMTVIKVIRREGISAGGEATMPKFTGSKLN